jgi:hypothetical protein
MLVHVGYAIGGKLPTRGDIADGDIIPTSPWGCPYKNEEVVGDGVVEG